jgi:uncharacterized protein
MINHFKIVDGHVHVFSSDEIANKITDAFNRLYDIEFVLPGLGSVQDVLLNMETNGIDYTVMANFTPPKILHKNNLWAIEVAKQNKKFIPLVSFHPDMEGNLQQMLEDYVEAGARGIKIHPMAQGFDPNADQMQPIYQTCNEMGLPVQFHCGRVSNTRLNAYADLDMILPIIKKYSQMPIVLNHMADGNRRDVLQLSQNYENVYFDTSIVISGYPPIMQVNEPSWLEDSEVVELIRQIGAEKVMFGSDYPWGSPGHDARRILSTSFTEEEKRQIMILTHDHPSAGHPGRDETIRKIKQRFKWDGMN